MNNVKQIEFKDVAREKLKNGVDTLANAVESTLGPQGRNVILDKGGVRRFTKDGVSVAKEIHLKNPIENIGAQMVKEVATEMGTIVGDGTTSSVLLARTIFNKGLAVLSTNNPIDMKAGMDKMVRAVVSKLEELSTPIEIGSPEALSIANISANDDTDIGEIVHHAVMASGKDGVVLIEEHGGFEHEFRKVDGIEIDRGYIHPNFSLLSEAGTDEVAMDNCKVLLCNQIIDNAKQLIPVLNHLANKGETKLLIICQNMEGQALATVIRNLGQMKIVVVKAPGYGPSMSERFDDLKAVTGAEIFSEDLGVKLTTDIAEDQTDMLGFVASVRINKAKTTIVASEDREGSIQARASVLSSLIEEAENEARKEQLTYRYGQLAGKIGIISAGGSNETDMLEKKDRIDDSLCAVKAAIEEGIVPGGGIAYLKIADMVKEDVFASCLTPSQLTGAQIIYEALKVPFTKICSNAGKEASETMINSATKDVGFSYGYDARNDVFGDLFELKVIDPAKVSRVALQQAASIAGLLLTTECVVTDYRQEMTHILAPMR